AAQRPSRAGQHLSRHRPVRGSPRHLRSRSGDVPRSTGAPGVPGDDPAQPGSLRGGGVTAAQGARRAHGRRVDPALPPRPGVLRRPSLRNLVIYGLGTAPYPTASPSPFVRAQGDKTLARSPLSSTTTSSRSSQTAIDSSS